MKYPFTIKVNNYQQALQLKDNVQIGHYFVFAKHYQTTTSSGRLKRLLVKKESLNQVLPLVEQPVELEGVTITPQLRTIEPIGCIVTDRDLYRAEQDTVHLFIAFPSPPANLSLMINCNGAFFTKREVQLTDGVGIETLSHLLPGNYEAQLSIADRRIGIPLAFTVAEYTLAPLSARLLNHSLYRNTQTFVFELAVESYQVPFEDQLTVQLIEQGREVSKCVLKPSSPGHYAGSLKMIGGEGPFRLRLMASHDAERVAEVAIPGTRQVERDVTVISELGQQKLFSMMPEAHAIPLRGGYLTEGDFLATPLTVENIVTEQRIIHAHTEIESLVLVNLDLTSGNYSIQTIGNVSTGNTITVNTSAPITNIFIGGFVNGQAFEGYTTFIQPSQFQLYIDVPRTIRPRTDLVVGITCEGMTDKTIPVLVCVRDERLTATDKPEVSLGAATKRGIDTAIKGMADSTLTPLSEVEEMNVASRVRYRQLRSIADDVYFSATPDYEDNLRSFSPPVAKGMRGGSLERETTRFASVLSSQTETVALKSFSTQTARAESFDMMADFEVDTEMAEEMDDMSLLSASKASKSTKSLRTEFPEVLFYDIVPVNGSKEVVIPVSDSLGTFTVETFALANGDWQQNHAPVVVEQPVRIDLELPPAVHPNDTVITRLYAITSSRQARITLTRNGEKVELKSPLTPLSEPNRQFRQDGKLEVNTPVELEFYVKPGTYRATVEDSVTGEMDSIEVNVGEPGKFKSYTKELGLLIKSEAIDLETLKALSLRVLPTIDTSFDTLITATADYTHLCCEQTAAKILAATFMYLTAKNAGEQNTAEQIILSGIAREQKMIRPGQGFAMYPDKNYISEHYSTLAVRYLWKLTQLEEIPDISNNLRQATREGLAMADQAAQAHQMQRMPTQIQNIEDAYTLATAGKELAAVQQFIHNTIDFSSLAVKSNPDAVTNRKILAYAAASLIALNDLEHGIKLANQVTRQFNEQGRLYSTVDSVAAIALMMQLRIAGIVTGNGRLRVNNQEMTTLQAAQLPDRVESIEVLEGVAAVEVTRIYEEDWGQFAYQFPIKVGFRDKHDKPIQRFRAGDRTDLLISLPQGYQTGDLVQVALPASMSWIQGGGKVKRFTLDFAGKNELRIPLVVTSQIEGKQHFAVCVRNMFEEERATSPGILTVEGKHL